MLYARINKESKQMLGEPQELPSQYNAGDGVVISGFNRMDVETISIFGWVPVEFEDNPNPEAYYRDSVPTYDPGNNRFIYKVIAREPSQAISEAEDEIDRAASSACSRHISSGVGQDMRYMEKTAQASAYMASLGNGEEPCPDDFLMLKLEAELCGMSIGEKAQEISDIKAAWGMLAANVEALRVGGKKAVRAMSNSADVVAKRKETVAALGGI